MKFIIMMVAAFAVGCVYGNEHEQGLHIDQKGHPEYHFGYYVHDPHTHDQKYQLEVRNGKNLRGEYSVLQPNGKKRVVRYKDNGHGMEYFVEYVVQHR